MTCLVLTRAMLLLARRRPVLLTRWRLRRHRRVSTSLRTPYVIPGTGHRMVDTALRHVITGHRIARAYADTATRYVSAVLRIGYPLADTTQYRGSHRVCVGWYPQVLTWRMVVPDGTIS
eukprot:1578033-Rhodomonas_salina.1